MTYLTAIQAAELAHCHPKTIHRAVLRGHLPAFRPLHRILLREQDVRAWIESRPITQASPRPRSPGQRRGRPAPSPGSPAELRALDPEMSRR